MIDFYIDKKVSPVSQDISNLNKHFDRRSSLYRHLGIPYGLIQGKSVIEFGPGSGYNSIYTASLKPSRYVLVDANRTGLEYAEKLMKKYSPQETQYEIVESFIEDYQPDKHFDLVLCEGTLTKQNDPPIFLKHLANFVKPGGLLLITCTSSISMQGDFLRKVIGDAINDFTLPLNRQVELLLPIFKPQLSTLKGMSRPPEDWIIDSIIQPLLIGKYFSIPEAIEVLRSSFDIYGSSPNFLTDWRWYKDITGENKNYNEIAINLYYENAHNFWDYRFIFPKRSKSENVELISICNDIVEYVKKFQDEKNICDLQEIVKLINKQLKK